VTPFRCLGSGAEGSRTTQALGSGNFNPSVTIESLYDPAGNGMTLLENSLGDGTADPASVDGTDQTAKTVNFSLYHAGSIVVQFQLDGVLTDTYSMSGISADADAVTQEVSSTATTLTVDTDYTA